ncbi:hypothetical protein [Treponema pedis]|uniref:hypothetical protein n=1 Tax=Treponema pedis TaxID=409322 RepID=UPI002091E2AB|nr:hypothetical protein [Treponema pedis]
MHNRKTSSDRRQSLAYEDKCSKKIGAVLVQQAYRRSFEASAVPHQKPYILVQFLIISFAYAKLIRSKSPPSVSERNCKNKIEQSAAQSCLGTFELRVFDKTSRIKPLNLLNSPTDRAFENRHVGCKEREKINRRRIGYTSSIYFYVATQEMPAYFQKR